jgi:hypothetical protein
MSGVVRIVVLEEAPPVHPSRLVKEESDRRSTFVPMRRILSDTEEGFTPAGGITQNESRS